MIKLLLESVFAVKAVVVMPCPRILAYLSRNNSNNDNNKGKRGGSHLVCHSLSHKKVAGAIPYFYAITFSSALELLFGGVFFA